jgi:hypothetical protein
MLCSALRIFSSAEYRLRRPPQLLTIGEGEGFFFAYLHKVSLGAAYDAGFTTGRGA